MPRTLSVSYGEPDSPFQVDVFMLDTDPREPERGVFVETLGFQSRDSLAIFFANGATMATDRYYRVRATV